jgi:ABC-type glycerol-3-phosphate transport system permease component
MAGMSRRPSKDSTNVSEVPFVTLLPLTLVFFSFYRVVELLGLSDTLVPLPLDSYLFSIYHVVGLLRT